MVYTYIFGDHIPHLHIHLAPHHDGDALNDQIIKGPLKTIVLESGIEAFVSDQYPALPEEKLRRIAEDIRNQLSLIH